MKDKQQKRWIPVPDEDGQTCNGQVLGVWLNENERVRWIRSYQPEGSRVVTGYEIIET